MLALQSLGEKGGFLIRENDEIKEITSEQAQDARRNNASTLRMTSEIISGIVRIDFKDYARLPYPFIQALDIHRQFIAENKDGGQQD